MNKRLKTYNTSEIDKIYFDYYILLEDSTIDKCIKHILRNKEYIKNKEFYSLKEAYTPKGLQNNFTGMYRFHYKM